jgi:hypothetical protein
MCTSRPAARHSRSQPFVPSCAGLPRSHFASNFQRLLKEGHVDADGKLSRPLAIRPCALDGSLADVPGKRRRSGGRDSDSEEEDEEDEEDEEGDEDASEEEDGESEGAELPSDGDSDDGGGGGSGGGGGGGGAEAVTPTVGTKRLRSGRAVSPGTIDSRTAPSPALFAASSPAFDAERLMQLHGYVSLAAAVVTPLEAELRAAGALTALPAASLLHELHLMQAALAGVAADGPDATSDARHRLAVSVRLLEAWGTSMRPLLSTPPAVVGAGAGRATAAAGDAASAVRTIARAYDNTLRAVAAWVEAATARGDGTGAAGGMSAAADDNGEMVVG